MNHEQTGVHSGQYAHDMVCIALVLCLNLEQVYMTSLVLLFVAALIVMVCFD